MLINILHLQENKEGDLLQAWDLHNTLKQVVSGHVTMQLSPRFQESLVEAFQ